MPRREGIEIGKNMAEIREKKKIRIKRMKER